LWAFYIEKPCKGATSYYAKKCYALSGLQFDTRDLNPGRRFALPWARLSEPFRLQKEESKGLSSCHSRLSPKPHLFFLPESQVAHGNYFPAGKGFDIPAGRKYFLV
jgi:hypothetical protein